MDQLILSSKTPQAMLRDQQGHFTYFKDQAAIRFKFSWSMKSRYFLPCTPNTFDHSIHWTMLLRHISFWSLVQVPLYQCNWLFTISGTSVLCLPILSSYNFCCNNIIVNGNCLLKLVNNFQLPMVNAFSLFCLCLCYRRAWPNWNRWLVLFIG